MLYLFQHPPVNYLLTSIVCTTGRIGLSTSFFGESSFDLLKRILPSENIEKQDHISISYLTLNPMSEIDMSVDDEDDDEEDEKDMTIPVKGRTIEQAFSRRRGLRKRLKKSQKNSNQN
jgi:hypothetical protein